MSSCTKLELLMAKQRGIIERHIDEHKWFKGIDDRGKAITDFINQYGWAMREMFCSTCSDHNGCDYYQTNFQDNSELDNEYNWIVRTL